VVWIVSHFEYLGPPYWLDELVSYIARTRARAFRWMRKTLVDPGTWWGIRPFAVEADDASLGPQVLYSGDGSVMKRGYSLQEALRLGRKIRARNSAMLRRIRRAEKKKGGTKHAPSRPG
jgi:hypothetical protein